MASSATCLPHGYQQPYGHPLPNSRQADIHATQGVRPLLADVLVGEQAEVAVLWPAPGQDLLTGEGTTMPLASGRGLALVQDLATLLGAPPPLHGPGKR